MTEPGRRERATGAIMGALIGDALGMGCHWYYDIDAMRRDCGPWVDGYRDCGTQRSDRFGYIARHRHELGLRAGDLSQTGEILVLWMEALAASGAYDESAVAARMDTLFESLNGEALSGRFSDRAVRETCVNRKIMAWGAAGSDTDTAEAAIWGVALAAASGGDMNALAKAAQRFAALTHSNPYINGYSVAFSLAVASLIDGVELGEIREHMVSLRNDAEIQARTSSVDIAFQIGNEAANMGADLSLNLDPVVVCRLFGMNCTMGFIMPAAYFLIHRYPDDFENAVLSAVNAGGNNMARAAVTGALSGALVGVSGIPDRLIDGLRDHERLLELAENVAELGLNT